MTDTTLWQGDCLEMLGNQKDETVDLVFADPPFNVGKKYGESAAGDRRLYYYEWCAAWIGECFRVLKPTGSFYLMTLKRHAIRMGLEMSKYGVWINTIDWRNAAQMRSDRSFYYGSQTIFLFGKSDSYKFNHLAQAKPISQQWIRWGGYSKNSGPKGQLSDLWDDIPKVYAGSAVHPEAILEPGTLQKAHPAQMPVALAARAILFSTDPGDTVLDPFAGSGTTSVACIKTGRKWIGIERVPKYVEMIRARIALAEASPGMFGPEDFQQGEQTE